MSSLGSMLLHLDASPRCEARLRVAQLLATRLGAGSNAPCVIDTLYGVTPSYLEQPFAFPESAANSLALLQDLDTERRSDAKKLFDRLNGSSNSAMRWHELKDENAIIGTTRYALLADLVVLGQHDPNERQALGVPADFAESVLIYSGRPGVVVPYVGSFADIATRVLIAWKPTREAARALSASVPLLQRCLEVHVVADAGDGQDALRDGALQSYLETRGVKAPLRQHAALAEAAPGEGLLSLAADVGADLLVMGCYGHSRARELVMGGASRTILRSMTLPVLMSH